MSETLEQTSSASSLLSCRNPWSTTTATSPSMKPSVLLTPLNPSVFHFAVRTQSATLSGPPETPKAGVDTIVQKHFFVKKHRTFDSISRNTNSVMRFESSHCHSSIENLFVLLFIDGVWNRGEVTEQSWETLAAGLNWIGSEKGFRGEGKRNFSDGAVEQSRRLSSIAAA